MQGNIMHRNATSGTLLEGYRIGEKLPGNKALIGKIELQGMSNWESKR